MAGTTGESHCGSCLVGMAFRPPPSRQHEDLHVSVGRWRRGFCTVPSVSDAPPKTLTFGGDGSASHSRQRTTFALGCVTGGGGRGQRTGSGQGREPAAGSFSRFLPAAAGSRSRSRVRRRVREGRSSALRAGRARRRINFAVFRWTRSLGPVQYVPTRGHGRGGHADLEIPVKR